MNETHDETERWLLRVEDVAIRLSIGRTRVYQLIASGELPSVRIGASRRIEVGALRRWIEQRASSEAGTEPSPAPSPRRLRRVT